MLFESGASLTPPTPPSPGSAGYPTDGVLGGSAPTLPGAYAWFQMMQEIVGVITAAGLTPSATDLGQLKEAMDALYVARSGGVGSGAAYTTLPGGFILQWGSYFVGDYSSGVSDPATVSFPVAFPHAVFNTILSWSDTASDVADVALVLRSQSTSGFVAEYTESSAEVEAMTINYIAIGN